MAFGKQILHKSGTNFLGGFNFAECKVFMWDLFFACFCRLGNIFKSHLGTSLLAAFPLFAWIFGKNCNFARSKQILKE